MRNNSETVSLSREPGALKYARKRAIAHWRLLSAVVVGVLLASAIMASTVIYYDALRGLALKQALDRHSAVDLDILVRGQGSPVTSAAYENISSIVNRETDRQVGWMLLGRISGGKTPTFFLTTTPPTEEGRSAYGNARAYFAFISQLQKHISILPGGTLPRDEPLSEPGSPLTIEVLVPAEAARSYDVKVGESLVAVPYWKDDVPYVTVVVTGLFEREAPSSEYWRLEEAALRESPWSTFTYVPFYVSKEAYLGTLGPSFREMNSTYAWFLATDAGRLHARNAKAALAGIEAMHSNLAATVTNYGQVTAMDDALREFDRRVFFGKLPMFVVLILTAVVILYYVATLSSLMVEDRRGELSLLRSRGASSVQILIIFVIEGTAIAALSVLLGPPLGAVAVSFLGITPAFSDITGGVRLAVHISSSAYLMSALGGVLSFAALMVPAVQASRIGVTQQRQESARPTSLPAFQRYYVDVLLLLIGILLFRQLTEQGSMLATSLFGELKASQMLLALPGLILVASAMVLLRLFPPAMGLIARILSPWLPAGLVLGMWQMARNPTHYSRLALLLILTAGLGVFASSFGATLERSFEERVLYSVGSDIRVDGIRRATTRMGNTSMASQYEMLPAVARASTVFRTQGRDESKTYGESFDVLAVDVDSFADVGWLREDFTAKPIQELLKPLRIAKSDEGIELPYDARSFHIRLKADSPHPSIKLIAAIKNRRNSFSYYPLGELETDDWTILETNLESGTRKGFLDARPLTLVVLELEESIDSDVIQGGSILIDDIWVTTEAGEREMVEGFDDMAGWNALHPMPYGMYDSLHVSDVSFGGDARSVLFTWKTGGSPKDRGIHFHGYASGLPLPVLASKTFTGATGHYVGEEFEISISGARKLARLVGTVNLFPTMTTPGQKFLVADVHSLDRVADLNALPSISDFPSLDRYSQFVDLGKILTQFRPNELWLSTASSTSLQLDGLRSRLSGDSTFQSTSVFDSAQRIAESKVDPLVDAGWKALLYIAFSAVLILSCLGFMVHGYVSFRLRHSQFALLRTVGLSMRQFTTMILLEQALIITTGLALGTWMGGRLGATIMPFLGYDDWGGPVMPPFVMQVDLGLMGITYAVMALIFAAVILALVWVVRKASLHSELRVGEM